MGARSAGVLQLRPVTFAYQQDAPGVVRYGLVAEEVQGVYPEMVTHTATGEPLAVRYQELIPMLLNELQREHQARQQESARVAALETQLAALQALVAARLGQTVAQDGPGESIR
jgi:Chaperone of endosialidase